MKKQKVLVTGSNGMLGHQIIQKFKDSYELYSVNRNHDRSNGISHSYLCDINNFGDIARIMKDLNPNIIIHTAAIVDVDYCEMEQEQCYKTNYLSVQNLIDNMPVDSLFVFISTESVFKVENTPPSENTIKNPPNFYSRLKSLSEDYILASKKNHIIIRTNIYGFHKNWRGSLVEWSIDKIKLGEELGGFYDVFFNPLYTGQAALIIRRLIENEFVGVIHLGSIEIISKLDFLLLLYNELGYPVNLIKPISIDSVNRTKRNKAAILDVSKLTDMFSELDLRIETGMRELLTDLKDSNFI